jgi:hypothetical protein
MTDKTQFAADLKRYADLIAPLVMPAPLSPTIEGDAAVQIERGVILAAAANDPNDSTHDGAVDRLIELSTSDRLAHLAVIDAGGHHRPVYRPLLVHAWLTAFSIRYETLPRAQFGRWEETIRPWCDLLEAELGRVTLSDESQPAERGASVAEAAWTALALQTAGKIFVRDVWIDLASDTFGRLARAQQPSGAFLATGGSANPELTWYHELCILHATAGYAVRAEDRNAARAVARNTEFHQNETQPDHATAQPWGLFAFIWNPGTRPLADQLLHTATLNRAGETRDGVSLILLADALYSLRLFL